MTKQLPACWQPAKKEGLMCREKLKRKVMGVQAASVPSSVVPERLEVAVS
eukprot:CAMPEP_0172916938 /NCGR_PEP_ID=MMETSP1075-20121228/197309_1 /TAXON_ID=2916 /ORGANISM="Ceratium fusus, Strain PA161109" /LENGTH=49 /DNA_ID= /DNA_START= /DNA_END= /DNA_ORIENTATION=